MQKSIPTIIDYQFFLLSSQAHAKQSVNGRRFSSLSFRKSGQVSISTTNQSLISTQNTLTFVPAGCTYETAILEDGERYILHFWLQDDACNLFDRPICVTPPVTDTFVNLFERALRHAQNLDDPFACMADAYRLLSEFYRVCREETHAPNAKMIACKRYLDEHLCDAELRVGELATQYGCSEVYFRCEFRKCYRLSPIDYIKRRRVELACHLLQTQPLPISEIATRSGFDSISYFSAEFRKMIGCSPSEYRAE